MIEEPGRLNDLFTYLQEGYLEPCQVTMMDIFAELLKDFYPLTIYAFVCFI